MKVESLAPSVSLGRVASTQWVDRLAAAECPAFTARRRRRSERTGASHDPIVWQRASGSNVVDVDGNRYVDLTSGFGASLVGHSHPYVAQVVSKQAETMPHALGDLHPSDVKIAALEQMQEIAPFSDARVMFALNGSDAVEVALKTSVLHTGRPGVLAFEGSYHGLANGPLAVSGYKESFRRPFHAQLNKAVAFAPWPAEEDDTESAIVHVLKTWESCGFSEQIGAVIYEPMQGRGGVRRPPAGFAERLRSVCDDKGALLIADEIFTGLGRCGTRWLGPSGTSAADIVCVGKALGGGYPISACVGHSSVMAAWADPKHYPGGEAIHTGTFFGHPIGCAAMLATFEVVEQNSLMERARLVGSMLSGLLRKGGAQVLGYGLMIGVNTGRAGGGLLAVQKMLERGYICLPAASDASVLQISPALNIEEELLCSAGEQLLEVLSELA